MIAAIVSVFVNIEFLFSSIAAPYVGNGFLSDALRELSLLERYDRFTTGIFEFKSILFFVSITVVFLFLTVRILEKRRWS
jgi:ABC-2 type transport system permease protein